MVFRFSVWALAWFCLASHVATAATLIDFQSTWRWFKGLSEASSPDRTAWRKPGFDDSSWREGPAPFSYGEGLPGTILADMRGNYTTVYLRQTFVVEDPAAFSRVALAAISDDGYIAWINGHEVARFNVGSGEIPYRGTALGPLNEPVPIEVFEIHNFRDVLVAGTNVIAVQAMNNSLAGSSDFVIAVVLEAEIDEQPPVVASIIPAPDSRVRELSRITVIFDEPVEGVDAQDLRINGVVATNLTGFGGNQYVFEFAPQPAGDVTVEWAEDAGIRDLSPRANAFAGKGWAYIVDPNLPPPGVSISEFMADNDETLNDEDGDASDWIEIENSSDEAVNLDGWRLTDTATRLDRWVFPPVTLPAHGYLLVFASGKDRRDPARRLHTNFSLSRSGGYLALVRPNGEIASEFASYPAQITDVSYGRLRTDPLKTGFFVIPTPGEPNGEGGPGFSPEVVFSRIGGTFQTPFTLTLSVPGSVGAIHYTTNGSVPTESSPVYSAPISISASTRVRARAYTPGLLPGPVRGEYYMQLNPTAASATSSLPYVVIHSFGGGEVPPDGEYMAFVSIYEPHGGVSSLTNAPDLRSRARVNIRGSSTLYQPKRNYSIEFRDERNVDLALGPLGMPEDPDWILYAPNNFEPVLIHNPLIYRMSNEIGRYAPRTRFVEVYVVTSNSAIGNQSYAGVYVLMEKIKRDSARVNVDKLEPEHTREPEVTGGYIMKIDRLDPGDSGMWAAGQMMGFVEPKEEEMRTPQRAPQRNYIQSYMDAFGDALYSANWQHPTLGWRAYVDEASWIDHHLLNVVAFNVDALRLSTYFYKPRGGELVFGPIWDFDRALNSTDGRDSNPLVWRSRTGDLGTDFFNYPWWGRMFQDLDFWQQYIDRYQELRRGAFSNENFFRIIDDLVAEVRPAQPREAARWPGFTTPRGSYENEVSSLKTWLSRRLNFMDTNFLAAPSLSPASGHYPDGVTVTLSGPPGATIYYTLDGSDPRAPGGAVAAGARVYSGPIEAPAGTVVRARARNLAHRNLTGPNNPPISTPWSGIVEGRYAEIPAARAGDLRLTEIQYRPGGLTREEREMNPAWSRSDFEFVEIANVSDRRVDLSRLRFAEGIEFSFATSAITELGPGERLVLPRNTAAFRARHGDGPRVAGEFQGGLSRNGEMLRVVDSTGATLIAVDFRSAWEPATDGHGFSLVPKDERTVPAIGSARADWRPSAARGGSPGAPDPEPPALPRVVVSEALSNPQAPLVDGIELENLSSAPADIGGWYLTDDRDEPDRFRIPDGVVIPPGGRIWFDESDFNVGANGFGLSSDGESVWLFAADSQGALLGYAHGFDFGGALPGVSFGREVTCDGRELFLAQSAVTPGAPNAGPLTPPVIISEIHYHPPDMLLGIETLDDTRFEFIELVNLRDAPTPLHHEGNPSNPWRLKNAVDFVFPPGATLPPRGVALVVSFDPDTNPQARARFESMFGVPAGTLLLGPYAGPLPNSEGRVELVRPRSAQAAEANVLVDGVTYSDAPPWPTSADGGGKSLSRVESRTPGDRPGAWIASTPTPGVWFESAGDSDGDGLPDAWEVAHCLNPQDPSDANEDPDGDGATNLAEYVASTDPRDWRDVLRWTAARMMPDRVELEVIAKAGVSYRVEARDDAGGAWSEIAVIPAAAATRPGVVEDAVTPGVGARFYRLVVGD
jgi:hypothetical protein